ncbi:hypothetical protein QAD02_013905 [Eretmocerus hayati]|uniref:Uncharacterized protein n=1 Tax=Eretmocerus hayati TaxID=131215 RepID=A0ACC2P4W7_9HYME|nr:hypothetical protein QAD02_013905 [Eretmocerus hayati]
MQSPPVTLSNPTDVVVPNDFVTLFMEAVKTFASTTESHKQNVEVSQETGKEMHECLQLAYETEKLKLQQAEIEKETEKFSRINNTRLRDQQQHDQQQHQRTQPQAVQQIQRQQESRIQQDNQESRINQAVE